MRYSIVALFMLLGGSQAWGGTIALRDYGHGPSGERLFTIQVRDRLEPSDLGRIKKLFKQAKRERLMVVALELGSWGGDADTGMAIAEYVHASNVRVMINGVCSSSCSYAALVALGDGRLLVSSTAVVGVHQVYDNGTRDPDRPWTKRAANQLRKWGAPDVPLDDMVDTLPDRMVWYYVDDLAGMGALKLDEDSSWWPW